MTSWVNPINYSASIGTVPVANGGTGNTTLTSGQLVVGAGSSATTSQAFSTTPTANTIPEWDAKKQLQAQAVFGNNYYYVSGNTTFYADGSTVTSGGQLPQYCLLYGSGTITMPVKTDMTTGRSCTFYNGGTLAFNINSSASNLLTTVYAQQCIEVYCYNAGGSGTEFGVWAMFCRTIKPVVTISQTQATATATINYNLNGQGVIVLTDNNTGGTDNIISMDETWPPNLVLNLPGSRYSNLKFPTAGANIPSGTEYSISIGATVGTNIFNIQTSGGTTMFSMSSAYGTPAQLAKLTRVVSNSGTAYWNWTWWGFNGVTSLFGTGYTTC